MPTTGHTCSNPTELATILELLEGEQHLLHPDGDHFGTTRQTMDDGAVSFRGNFWELSHAFHIQTDDAELIDRLDRAIARQRASEAYKQAAVENRERHATWAALRR